MNGQHIQLQLRDDRMSHRMLVNGQRVVDDLNTERGHDLDPQATVYVLNPLSGKYRQVRFVVSKNADVEEPVLLGSDRLQQLTHLKAMNN